MAQESWNRDKEETTTGCGPPEGPILCANGCGFFGQATTMNMCSKCFREKALMDQSSAAAAAAIRKSAESPPKKVLDLASPPEKAGSRAAEDVEMKDAVAQDDAVAASADAKMAKGEPVVAMKDAAQAGAATSELAPMVASPAPPSPTPPNRCATCKKRVGLTGFKCRCGSVFCSLHRYSDKHACSFDYKAAGRESIAKANPTVVADKITRI